LIFFPLFLTTFEKIHADKRNKDFFILFSNLKPILQTTLVAQHIGMHWLNIGYIGNVFG